MQYLLIWYLGIIIHFSMDKKDKLCRIASEYFNISEKELYESLEMKSTIAKYIVWYIMHTKHYVPTSQIAKKFNRKRNMIFKGIAKVRGWIECDKQFLELYSDFMREYEKKEGSHKDIPSKKI